MAKPIRRKKRPDPLVPLDESREKRDKERSPDSPPSSIVHRAFSGWPMIIGWLAMMIFAFHACTHMVAAGDTWVAMACGRHFLNHGVDTIEPFSANSHKAGPTPEEVKTWPKWAQWITDKVGIETVRYWHPTGWVNQNWLTHVIFYWLTTKSPFADAETFSFNTLVYWKFAIYIITVICVYYIARILGVNPALSVVFACFAMFIGRSFLDVRPAGFSNMLVAVFLLVLVLAVYRNILYIWLIVPVTVFWCNVHGGYIYVFIMLVPFVALNILTIASKKRFTSIGLKGIYHTIAAGLVAFVATVLFNPFHLTNLTHTFIISFSKHAERWRDVHEWHPAFDWTNPVGTAVPFLVMYIMALLLLLLWAVVLISSSRSIKKSSQRKIKPPDEYDSPKIDLPLMAIAALTIYMAIRSRRFIPIAAIAACPILAMFIDQMIRAVSAARNLRKNNRLAVPQMPDNLQWFLILAGAVTVSYFGTWWGLKFKRVYLDPWPTNNRLNSVFMRMTASDAKPFYAGQFIKDNKLKGKMFNYWTEGGFIAWAQEPDPNTGKTPLQLFMDGRAQAAYDRRTFDLWTYIMSAGPTIQQAQVRAKATRRRLEDILTVDDYKEIGQWVNQQMKKYDVWVVLMPAAVYSERNKSGYHFVRALEYSPDWRLIFLNNGQKLFVDGTTPQALQLYQGIWDGKTVYPNDFSKYLILAHIMLAHTEIETKQKGLDYAIKAFRINPSQVPMQKILYASRFPELRKQVDEFCKEYFDDFEKNKNVYVRQHGYHNRIAAALNAISYLRAEAQRQKNTELVQSYSAKLKEYVNERVQLLKTKRW